MPTTATRTKRTAVTPEDLHELTFVSDPQISPDGERVLFTHKRIGKKNAYDTELWMVPADGGTPHAFTHGPRDGSGRWSADGTKPPPGGTKPPPPPVPNLKPPPAAEEEPAAAAAKTLELLLAGAGASAAGGGVTMLPCASSLYCFAPFFIMIFSPVDSSTTSS